MWIPTYEGFIRQWAKEPPAGRYFSQLMHPNPRFYKYTWRVWTPDSPWEGAAFFADAPLMCTAESHELETRLLAEQKHFFVYNVQRPRFGGPFDQTAPKWAQVIFAPAYDDDPDPVWKGHK